jgi:hypothetical protein
MSNSPDIQKKLLVIKSVRTIDDAKNHILKNYPLNSSGMIDFRDFIVHFCQYTSSGALKSAQKFIRENELTYPEVIANKTTTQVHIDITFHRAAEYLVKYVHSNLVYGHGINDVEGDSKFFSSYKKWAGMLERCYVDSIEEKRPTYIGCSVSPEWLYFSNFKTWFENNELIVGYALDKDILVKGNKIYGPEFCSFVPPELNNLLGNAKKIRGEWPVGVIYRKKRRKFTASVSRGAGTRNRFIGDYDTPEAAFLAYKLEKESIIKSVAFKYFSKGLIAKRTYDALCSYQIEMDD